MPKVSTLNTVLYGDIMAEGEGFEPPAPFRVQWFSRPPPSTTRPSLRVRHLIPNHFPSLVVCRIEPVITLLRGLQSACTSRSRAPDRRIRPRSAATHISLVSWILRDRRHLKASKRFFEPLTVFKTASLNHSDIPPSRLRTRLTVRSVHQSLGFCAARGICRGD